MECSRIHEHIDAWLDGECGSEMRAEIELHLLDCAHCQRLVQQRTMFDRELQEVLHLDRAASDHLVEGVLRQLPVDRKPAALRPSPFSTATWFQLLCAAAAGFVLAAWIFGPQSGKPPAPSGVVAAPLPQIRLTAATGRVELFDAEKQEWSVLPSLRTFACPSDSIVRTADDAQCEIQTEDGCVVRLNHQTEVAMIDSRVVELRRGQMWCRAPQTIAMEVRVVAPEASSSDNSADSKSADWDAVRCDVGPASKFTCAQSGNDIHLINASGAVNVYTTGGEQQLAPGEAAHFSNGQLGESPQLFDPILSTRWFHPLLAQKSMDDAELHERVNEMLAQIGQEKLTRLYEQEIRALGEHAAWPLVQFVRSPLSAGDANQRLIAMKLAADLAPVWLIPEFIELLEDGHPEVRVLAAATLERLSGRPMQIQPEQWREPTAETRRAVRACREWWQENQQRFPTPALRLKGAGE